MQLGRESRGFGSARFEIVHDGPAALILRDLGPWDKHPTITNDAEGVVASVVESLNGRRLFYVDSEGECDELVVKNGRYAREIVHGWGSLAAALEFFGPDRVTCPDCGGRKFVSSPEEGAQPCPGCKGIGNVPASAVLALPIAEVEPESETPLVEAVHVIPDAATLLRGLAEIVDHPDAPAIGAVVMDGLVPNAYVRLASAVREAVDALEGAPDVKPIGAVVSCECGRGPREIVKHVDGAGVPFWTLAPHCTTCLEGIAEALNAEAGHAPQ